MKNTIYHPPRKIPVLGQYDVVVCGGGPAGCAAAIAAARHGAKTLLLEKYGFLGGATVAQLVSVVLSTNAVDFQGIWHEWAARLLRRRAMAPLIRSASHFYPDCAWYRSSVDSEGVKLVWDNLLEEAGAETLLLAHFCGACVEDDRITGVLAHTRAGLRLVKARRVIDATGDAAVCHEAGVPWDRGVVDKLWPQQVSLFRRLGGFPVPGSEGGAALAGGGTAAYRPEALGRVDRLRVDPLDPLAISSALRAARREIQHQAESLPAGRCISAGYLAQGSLRIQQTCMATGQAAGVAAALSIQADKTPRELEPAAVVKQLEADRDVETALDMSR